MDDTRKLLSSVTPLTRLERTYTSVRGEQVKWPVFAGDYGEDFSLDLNMVRALLGSSKHCGLTIFRSRLLIVDGPLL